MRSTAAVRLATFATVLAFAVPASAGYIATTVASNLNNPRGLAFGPEGALGLHVPDARLSRARRPPGRVRAGVRPR